MIAIVGSSPRWLLAYPIAAGVGLAVSARLSPAVERGVELSAQRGPPLHRSKGIVIRLAALFALDSFGGGFVRRPSSRTCSHALWRLAGSARDPVLLDRILQALSFQAAVRLAERFGLLRIMVFSHLPSNVLLAAIAFAPNLSIAIALLLARFALSQMDVPTRQAYVIAVVDPSERTAAAAYTNTARPSRAPSRRCSQAPHCVRASARRS